MIKSIRSNKTITSINTIVRKEKNVGISFLIALVVIISVPDSGNIILSVAKINANIINVIIAFLSI